MPEAAVGRASVLAALGANMAVAITKLVGFVLTGSSSLLAETFHSFADCGNQALLLLGSHRAAEPSSPTHPFGRGHERYFWAFVVGLVLFGLGGAFSVYEGIRKLVSGGHQLTSPALALALLAVAAVIEGLSLRTAVGEANEIRPKGQSWWHFIRATRNPEVSVVVFEDGAAIVGLLIAASGVVATWLTGNPNWDGAASVTIGLVLCAVATMLTSEMKSLLIGETVRPERADLLAHDIERIDGVARVLNLRTEHLGPDQVLVCVKIAISPPADLDRVVAVVDAVEAQVQLSLPETLTCYVEPDFFDDARVDWT